ncbi:hypothetical protein [Arthrobacter sp. D2-10]
MGEAVKDNDLQRLLDQLTAELPREEWKSWAGGRKGQIEAALTDAVLSIQANYGSEENGVRAAVRRYSDHVGESKPDDLARLSKVAEPDLQIVLNNQRISGRTKASAIAEAAHNLVHVGVRHADQLDPKDSIHKRAYTSVHGLGHVTWEYFGMLLGKPGVKADTWIQRFVGRALGRKTGAEETRRVVIAASEKLKVNPIELDHAIWAYERRRKAPSPMTESIV